MQDERDHRDDQQQVDEAAGDVEGEYAQQPEDGEDDGDGCKHGAR